MLLLCSWLLYCMVLFSLTPVICVCNIYIEAATLYALSSAKTTLPYIFLYGQDKQKEEK